MKKYLKMTEVGVWNFIFKVEIFETIESNNFCLLVKANTYLTK